MDTLALYRHALDGVDEVLSGVDANAWDAPSTCPEWSVRDVAGHLIWGQHQLRAWAIGEEYADRSGAPGSPRPGVLAADDPLATWRAARAASAAVVSEADLPRIISVPGIGEVPIAAVVAIMMTDQATHSWDIGHALGRTVKLDPELVETMFGWVRQNAIRRPGFFGPERPAPEGCDEQTRMLAFMGRDV